MSWKNFKLSDFSCPCCGANEIKHYFIDMLQEARILAGVPFSINSGYRCPAHNKKVGGKPTSDHLTGEGADIGCTASRERFLIVDALLTAGIKRIGIAKTFIHAGSRDDNPQGVLWLY